jgi:hypothetical protein
LACLGPDQREDILPEARSERTKLRAGGDQWEYILPEARSEGIEVRRRQIKGNIYFLKPDQRGICLCEGQIRRCKATDGPHIKEDSLVGRQIRGNVYCLKPDQRARSFTRGRSGGDIGLFGTRSERRYTS